MLRSSALESLAALARGTWRGIRYDDSDAPSRGRSIRTRRLQILGETLTIFSADIVQVARKLEVPALHVEAAVKSQFDESPGTILRDPDEMLEGLLESPVRL